MTSTMEEDRRRRGRETSTTHKNGGGDPTYRSNYSSFSKSSSSSSPYSSSSPAAVVVSTNVNTTSSNNNDEHTPLIRSFHDGDNDDDDDDVIDTTDIDVPVVTESERDKIETAASIAKQESSTIILLRIVVLSVMAASTAIVAASVYATMKRNERETFEQSFQHSSESLFNSVGRSLYATLGAVDTFVVSMVALARYSNMDWPYVTIPDYAVQLSKVRSRANIACVNQFVLIPTNQRHEWEVYASQQNQWVQDGLRVQSNDVNYHGSSSSTMRPIPTTTTTSINDHQRQQRYSDSIMGSNGPFPNQTTIPYLVSWQSSPVMPTSIPYNVEFSTVYSNPDYRMEAIDHHKVIMAEVYNVKRTTSTSTTPTTTSTNNNDKSKNVDESSTTTITTPTKKKKTVTNMDKDDDEEEMDEVSKSIIEYIKYLDPHRDPSEPMSDIIYPILRDASDAITVVDSNPNNATTTTNNNTAVGFLIATLFWTDLIRHVLPIGTNGIIFIMENDCNQIFSYQIDGPIVTYLGQGDHHNPIYDDLKQETSFHELAKTYNDVSSSGAIYTGLSLSDKGCPFHLRVYPTEEYESLYQSNDPFLYTIIILLIFGFMSCLFCAWDSFVERRQKIVMQTVLESSANVCHLEQRVHERTKKIQETNKRLEEANHRLAAASAAQLQTFASMSHEIRTPLNCVIGLSSLLMETNLNPSQAESMQMIASSSDLLLAVVNDVLDYSKLESGNVEIEIRRTNLQEILNSVVFAIETKAEDGNVGLRTHFGANVGSFMHTDGRRLQQILYNLLGNAIKFSNPHSSVELTLTMCDECCKPTPGYGSRFYSPTDDKAETKSSPTQDWNGPALRFSVKNYGKGILMKDLKKIFKPFQQSTTNSEDSGGTGLGLAITTRLVHALRGRISVESCSGEWAMFTVELPWSLTEPADIQQLSEKVKKVLVSLVSQQSEVVEQLKGVFDAFSIEQSLFGTMIDLKRDVAVWKQTNGGARKKHLICIVDEELYDRSIYEELGKSTTCLGLSLVTFGPKHIGTDTQDHFRSLVRLIPSVLVEHLGSYISGVHTAKVLAREGSSRAVTEAEKISYQRYRVLIAEDNVINQKVLVRMLKRLGLENIDVVDNGQQAVDLEASKEFDVVFMDMSMPVMDGVEACEHIMRRDTSGSHPKAKVFFVTAHAAVEYESVCEKAGGAGFLPKPYNIRDIENCFQKLHALLEERID